LSAGPARPGAMARLGSRLWGLFTSVDFAVAQIIVLAVFGVIGMTIQQLPGFAFRSATDYASQMDRIHARYDASLGSGVVDVFERIGVFHVFGSWWFSLSLILLLISIVVCTIDRTPRLWRQSTDIRVVQPDAFFDPRLPDRAAMDGLSPAALEGVLRRHRFRVRRAEVDGAVYLYGDRNQYTKMATLFTHLGLILFLVAAAVTSRFGFEAPLVVAAGTTSTVQPIGTPGLLIVKNNGFDAPLLPDGAFADFTTDLSVYRDGREIARKTIRVNDPLSVAGFTFHQNGFGPAPDITIRGADGGLLWSGPVSLTDSVDGRPYGTMGVPGQDYGIQLVLDRSTTMGSAAPAPTAGASTVPGTGSATLLVLPYRVVGTNPDGTSKVQNAMPFVVDVGRTMTAPGLGITVEFDGVAAYSLLIAKQDPGQGIVWTAFGSLMLGLLITFYLPRRRVWTRVSPGGAVAICGRSDRYVDFRREFGRLLDDLVAVRQPHGAPSGAPASPSTAPPTPA
jgi:cytochrome c biogenesis protein